MPSSSSVLRPVALVPVLAALALAPEPAAADDLMLGVRLGYYAEVEEPFVGAELLGRLAPRFYFNPNFEYVLTEGFRYFTVNGDFHYDFARRGDTSIWAGGGLALVTLNPKGPAEGDSDLGVNLLAGASFGSGPLLPYVQLKVIAKDDTEAVFAFGLRF